MANRILQYLHCDCCRRRQQNEHLQRIAIDLNSRVLTDLVMIEVYNGDLHVTISESWEIDHPDRASGELAELLKEVAHNLDAVAARLEGGAA